MQTILRSDRTKASMVRVTGPALFAFMGIALFGTQFPNWRFLFVLPFLLIAFFGLSAAVVEVHNNAVRFRRLLKWTTISRREVVAAKVELAPFLGSIRLKRFVPPWGKLYFILDGPSIPFHNNEYQLLAYLKAVPTQQEENSHEIPNGKHPPSTLKLFVVALAGAVIYSSSLFLRNFIPAASASNWLTPANGQHTLIGTSISLLTRFEVQFAFFIIFSFFAIYRRREPSALIFAFLAGLSFPYVIINWLKFLLDKPG